MKKIRVQTAALLILLVVLGLVVYDRQAITDWGKLRGYVPAMAIAQLATDDTMTDKARHLLYVNRPEIAAGTTFTGKCPKASEKTIVLGCYVGNDDGIFIYKVDDPRLDGVEQVTIAHETLHAAYRRLPSGERSKVDSMLMYYYQHQLTDQRIKDTIASYKQSEPNDVVNEMHSVFGTEIANLPAGLEAYYKQYFTDRTQVVAQAAKYQAEFTSRQDQVAQYDAQLKQLKAQIEANEAQLDQQKTALDAQSKTMDSERASGQIAAYNSQVASYNQAVGTYRSLASATKAMIDQYNGIVEARNAIALEAAQLTKELSAVSVN
jgi:hypothetical protein